LRNQQPTGGSPSSGCTYKYPVNPAQISKPEFNGSRLVANIRQDHADLGIVPPYTLRPQLSPELGPFLFRLRPSGKVLAMLSKNPRDSLVPLRVWIVLEHAMIHKLHFGSATPAREALQTKTLIADISRIVQILDSDIAAEEEHARVYDRSQVEYPMLARTMAARRDNLLNTISALEQRLAKLDQAELVAEPA
jgi:hypothetical protein